MSSILDDAREKIANNICGWCVCDECPMGCAKYEKYCQANKEQTKEILAISGTTDIECPECKDGFIKGTVVIDGVTYPGANKCPACDNGVIKHKWKVSVTLENGELPKSIHELPPNQILEPYTTTTVLRGYRESQQDMLNEDWVKDVRQVVE